MARALELKVHYSAVSNYELGTREPDLIIVLRYARLAGVPMEMLVDDKLNLPERYENFSHEKAQKAHKKTELSCIFLMCFLCFCG